MEGQIQEDLMILMGTFQLRIFCDYMLLDDRDVIFDMKLEDFLVLSSEL